MNSSECEGTKDRVRVQILSLKAQGGRVRAQERGARAARAAQRSAAQRASHLSSFSHSHSESLRSRGRGARATGQSVSQLPFTVPPRAQHLLSGVEARGRGRGEQNEEDDIGNIDIDIGYTINIDNVRIATSDKAASGGWAWRDPGIPSLPPLPVLAVARCHPHNSSAIQCIQVHSRPHVRTHGRHNSSHDDALESRVRPSTQHASTHTSHSPQHATATSACRDDKVAEAGRAHAKLSSSCGLFLKRYSAM